MGRGNAVERAARAQAKLQAASEAQVEIGKQALKAIDNGVDPELAFSLADKAAKELVIEQSIDTVQDDAGKIFRETQNSISEKEKIVHNSPECKIRALAHIGKVLIFSGGLDGEFNGIPCFVRFEEHSDIATTNSIFATFLTTHYPDDFVIVSD